MRIPAPIAILVLGLAGAFPLACMASGAKDGAGSPGPAPSSPPRFGNDGDAGLDVGGGGGDGASCMETVTADISVSADTILIGGASPAQAWCNGANYGGDFPQLNVGVGIHSVGAFRFALPEGLASAIAAGSPSTKMDLILKRSPTGGQCGTSPCPQACGTLTAFGMRSDWEEGATSFSPYSGADWCRRGSGAGAVEWEKQGATGALDTGAAAGSTPICDGLDHSATPQSEVDIAITPSSIASWIDGSRQLTIRVEPTDGGVFTAASRENGAVAGAVLHVTYCTM
jgi:hypothetical protein